MLRKIQSDKMGRGRYAWLNTHYHFSFANYFNPENINFGQLRVINDDIIAPHTGFDTHPHNDMEIITYVIDGELTHRDSMGHKRTLKRGQVQYMSAGYGITHSEHNEGDDPLRLLQIWIFPDSTGYTPNYGDIEFEYDDRHNKLMHIASHQDSQAPFKINQDINMYATELDSGESLQLEVGQGRQAYVVQIEGNATFNNVQLEERDGLEIVEENVEIVAKSDAHILIIEMNKE